MNSNSEHYHQNWMSMGSTSVVPPNDYWIHLKNIFPDNQVGELQLQSDKGNNEFDAAALPPPKNTAIELLEQVVNDGWLYTILRRYCPNSVCNHQLNDSEAAQEVCPECNEAFSTHGRINEVKIYVRNLEKQRSVEWIIAIHGMNTSGAWQEIFSWYFGTTWGRSVPVVIYKYGIIRIGVILSWRRRKLQAKLREKLVFYRDKTREQGFKGNPDLIAHSFGTWLIGHLLRDELKKDESERLKFGRIILTGCILRPDFDWKSIKEAGLVEEVLNHYGSKDKIVPMAHYTINDSGPSGRYGFNSYDLINIPAEGCGHSDLFSIDKYISNNSSPQKNNEKPEKISNLDFFYKHYWRPFLTLPTSEFKKIPEIVKEEYNWKPMPWLLRGPVFKLFVLPILLVISSLIVITAGSILQRIWNILIIILLICIVGIILDISGIVIVKLLRKIRKIIINYKLKKSMF